MYLDKLVESGDGSCIESMKFELIPMWVAHNSPRLSSNTSRCGYAPNLFCQVLPVDSLKRVSCLFNLMIRRIMRNNVMHEVYTFNAQIHQQVTLSQF